MSPSKVNNVDFQSFSNIVDGQPRGGKAKYNGINPATKEKSWDVPIATQQDVEDAVSAARKAFPSWSKTPFEQRAKLLVQFADAYEGYEKEFTDLMVAETGKPRQFAIGEVKGTKAFLMHHASLKLPEERIEDDEKVVTTRYVPLGVAAAICPWNFPLVLSAGKIAPAVLTGNCIIVKPSPFTPYTALKLCEIAQQIFPPGVVQVLGGDDKLGPWLVSHPNIQKISFTGSIATGKKIMENAAKTLKRVTLELGGNDASIVLPDVDIEKTAPEVAMGAFYNSGQVCVATKRIYIHQDIYESFLKAMIAFTKSIKVGSSDEAGVLVGPIQNEMQYEKVQQFFQDSKKNGYKFAVGTQEVEKSAGYFIQPTIIDNPPNDSRIITEEPFGTSPFLPAPFPCFPFFVRLSITNKQANTHTGPIVPCQPWTDEAEVIARANNTNAGLGACVWGKDVEHAERIGRQLEAGSVFINSWEKPTPQAIFGGHKESGIGGEWGTMGLLAYCNAQALHVYKSK